MLESCPSDLHARVSRTSNTLTVPGLAPTAPPWQAPLYFRDGAVAARTFVRIVPTEDSHPNLIAFPFSSRLAASGSAATNGASIGVRSKEAAPVRAMTVFGPTGFLRSRHRPSGTGASLVPAEAVFGLTACGLTARGSEDVWRRFSCARGLRRRPRCGFPGRPGPINPSHLSPYPFPPSGSRPIPASPVWR